MSMVCHQEEFQFCLDRLNEADTPAVVTRLEMLKYADRIRVLKMRSGFNTVLTRIIKLISSDSYKEKNVHMARNSNPVKKILSSIKSEHRLQLLLIGDDEYKETPMHRDVTCRREESKRSTPLHVGCRYDDTETISCILQSVSSRKEVSKLLSTRDFLGETVLHTTVEFGSVETVSCLINGLPTETVVNLLKRQNNVKRTPLHKSAYNPLDEKICLMLVHLLMAAYDKYATDVLAVLMAKDMDSRTFLAMAVEYLSHSAVEVLLNSIPLKLITLLLKKRDMWQQVPLHRAVFNESHPDVVKLLLELIVKSYESSDVMEMLLATDEHDKTFIHWAAYNGSPELMGNIIKALPRYVAIKLSHIKDRNGRRITEFDDWALKFTWINQSESILKKDWLRQAGSYPIDFYPLAIPPKVLVFCNGRTRSSDQLADPLVTCKGSGFEGNQVEAYFKDRGFPCEVAVNYTETEILAAIRTAETDEVISGLLVFILSCGSREAVKVPVCESLPDLKKIIRCMCEGAENRPKVLIAQVDQSKNSPTSLPDIVSGITIEHGPSSDSQPDTMSGSSNPKWPNIAETAVTCPADFLLYLSTPSDTDDHKVDMIQSFISSLRELNAGDCITDACRSANQKLVEAEPHLWSQRQLPSMLTTFSKKFCVAKDFSV